MQHFIEFLVDNEIRDLICIFPYCVMRLCPWLSRTELEMGLHDFPYFLFYQINKCFFTKVKR